MSSITIGLLHRKMSRTFFYRFEFHDRGTVHLHMLIWLKDITKAQHQYLRADIPHSHPELAFLVHKLQPSDKKSHCLKLHDQESYFTFENGKQVHHLKHPAEEFALNLRAYIATIIPALKCRMDYQTTDGVAMLLRYVTSYITKSHDCTNIDSLYSYKLEGRQAAMRYLMRNMPAEPEMWFFLFSKKVAWSCSPTKRFAVPNSENAMHDKTVQKYWNRTKDCEHLTLLQWLHTFDTNKTDPKPYKQGSTLVGTKTVSLLNKEYFFQFILLNMTHRNLNNLKHPNHDKLPHQLQWFAAALHNFPEFWSSSDHLKRWLSTQGHCDSYITTILSYIASLRDLFYLVRIQVIAHEQLETLQPTCKNSISLDSYQQAAAHHIATAVKLRDTFYHTNTFHTDEYFSDSDSDTDSELYSSHNLHRYMSHEQIQDDLMDIDLPHYHHSVIRWEKPILIIGKPGAGKTETICQCVCKQMENDKNILVAAPTGFLARRFRAILHTEVDCETVHSAFHIPVDLNQQASTNWHLSEYDIVIIDEISMISEKNFQHILHTISRLIFRPVLVVCGDYAQQQPFEKLAHRTVNVSSPLNDKSFVSSTYCYFLNGQHRVGDSDYLAFLNHIRHWIPTDAVLQQIQEGRILCPDGQLHPDQVIKAFQDNPQSTFLTFTNAAANKLNSLITSALFANRQPLAYCQLDSDTDLSPIYKHMRVMITQNRDKTQNIVNGQIASIELCHNATIILKLPGTKLVATYPVTSTSANTPTATYPFRLGYANTMCKAQGQTLR